MLSDKVPDKGVTIPRQVSPPRDRLKLYSLVGALLGIVALCLLRNLLQLPDVISPFRLLVFFPGQAWTLGLQDVAFGAVLGSLLGIWIGRKVRAREEDRRFFERHPELEKEQQKR